MGRYCSGLIVLFPIICVLICTKNVAVATPEANNEWVIEVNNLFMYELVKGFHRQYWSVETAQFVLEEICNKNNIDTNFVDKDTATSSLVSKIKYLFVKVKQLFKRGWSQGLKFLDKTKTTVKLGGVKRKMQHDLESERKRRKLAEGKMQKVGEETKPLKKEMMKTKILVNRLLKKTQLTDKEKRWQTKLLQTVENTPEEKSELGH